MIENTLDEFKRGLQCNYPLCCIMWYCSVWSSDNLYELFICTGELEKTPKGRYITTEFGLFDNQYINCPDCIIKGLKR